MKRTATTTLFFLLLFMLLPGMALKADTYKYFDENGVVVLSNSIPPENIKYGYVVLNDSGKVLEVVPRSLSEEEQAEKQKQDRERARLAAELKKQQAADDLLLQLYAEPKEVIFARDAELHRIDKLIENAHSNLARLENQKKSLLSEAVEMERAGGTVTKEHLDNMSLLANRIKEKKLEIEKKNKQRGEVKTSYDEDYERVVELTTNEHGSQQEARGEDDSDWYNEQDNPGRSGSEQ